MPEQDEIITIIDEEGQEHDVNIFDVLEVDGQRYAIVVPVAENGEAEDGFVLKVEQDEDGDDILVEIDDDEWEKVKNACMEEYEFDIEE
ncbi:Protein of unknown function [Desulfoscipio geothermicus DSM 3669]|uniref:Uncharacterized protein n=1 Tax=Desulfoscipio geothermicus DSM 3669 TaxID=1121426 RepID=A0A1I6DBY5_9FIRM|nr:DUF1292 domain-containing protein [Desulfoscipio geothermicus]SFR02954.1 Protein of unknown function [Desulfoscipio geothermicus DSM 3669]